MPGPSVAVGDLLVTPVARRIEVGFGAGPVGAGFETIRPLRVDIERSDGTQTSLPITDYVWQLRLLVVVAIVVAFIIGRMRS